jgi:DNA-binding transcriptional LysR family regulator
MEWQQIVGFYHVAKLGSFTKAAQATFRTQSALSQQVKTLEAELDCILLERLGKRKIMLTPAGEECLRFAETVLDSYDHLIDELNDLKEVQKGNLRIAAPFTTFYHLFPELLKEYARRFPLVRPTLLDVSQTTVIELVRSGEVDFGLVPESRVPGDMTSLRWKSVQTVLLVPHGHPLASSSGITMEEIAKYPLILPPKGHRPNSRTVLEEKLGKLGLPHHVIVESSNVELSSLYVEIGLGISFATVVRDVSFSERRRVVFVPLTDHFEQDHIAVVMRKNKTLAPYKRAFLKSLMGEGSESDTETKQDTADS